MGHSRKEDQNIKWKITEKPSENLIVLKHEIGVCDLPSERLENTEFQTENSGGPGTY